jgi:hypothetical protein
MYASVASQNFKPLTEVKQIAAKPAWLILLARAHVLKVVRLVVDINQ